MKTKILSVLYFLSGITFILLNYYPGFLPEITVKGIIIPLLIILFLINITPESIRSHWLMLLALLFSWAGDVALEIPGQSAGLFITGLLCFMTTHILYLTVFYITPGKSIGPKKLFLFILPVYLFGLALLCYLNDDLGDMRIPVIVYTAILLSMLAAAITRINKVSRLSFYLVLTGAVLFVLSDSLLAINKFSHPLPNSTLLIMSTYVTGQFLIVLGYIKQYNPTA